MNKQKTPAFIFKYVYPNFRFFLSLGRRFYSLWIKISTLFSIRPTSSPAIPDSYLVCNTSTINSDFDLNCLEGEIPGNIDGSLYIAQCLGTLVFGPTHSARYSKADFQFGYSRDGRAGRGRN